MMQQLEQFKGASHCCAAFYQLPVCQHSGQGILAATNSFQPCSGVIHLPTVLFNAAAFSLAAYWRRPIAVTRKVPAIYVIYHGGSNESFSSPSVHCMRNFRFLVDNINDLVETYDLKCSSLFVGRHRGPLPASRREQNSPRAIRILSLGGGGPSDTAESAGGATAIRSWAMFSTRPSRIIFRVCGVIDITSNGPSAFCCSLCRRLRPLISLTVPDARLTYTATFGGFRRVFRNSP